VSIAEGLAKGKGAGALQLLRAALSRTFPARESMPSLTYFSITLSYGALLLEQLIKTRPPATAADSAGTIQPRERWD
jgi:hypothetical protein